MDDQAEQLILKLVQAKSKVTPMVGRVVGINGTGFVVDVSNNGTGRVPCKGTGYLPVIGEAVNVLFIDEVAFMWGSAEQHAGQGTVASVDGTVVNLTTTFGTVRAPFMAGIIPTVGDVWAIMWQGGPYAVTPLSYAPTPPTPPDPPAPVVSQHVDVFTAIDAGSYSSSFGGWNQSQVLAADHWQGCWFYGSKIPDTVPVAAVPSKLELYVSIQSQSGADPTFALHAYQSKPGGAPSFGSSQTIPLASGWITLPLGWASSLQSGGGSFGVGINHGGYSTLSSLAQDGQSGAIRLTSTY